MTTDHGDEVLEAVVTEPDTRLDVFVAAHAPGLDRVAAGALVRDGRVEVPGRPWVKPTTWLAVGEVVRMRLPAPRAAEAEPQDLPLPFLYADDDLVVVHKPAGMATHPGPGWWKGSAVNALLFHVPRWRPIGGVATPGIVHRLDRDTGGLLVFANGEAAHQQLLAAMRDRHIERRYLAVVRGDPGPAGEVDLPLARDPDRPDRVHVDPAGKSALTRWRAIAHHPEGTLIELALETGRNHQIRVHMAAIGHPVAGDPWYGDAADGHALRLHAYRLSLTHPRLGARLTCVALPEWARDHLR